MQNIKLKSDRITSAILVICLSIFLSGFVQIAPEQPKLPVDVDNPRLAFSWDGSLPASIIERYKYKNGIFENSTEKEMFEEILTEAMETWNEIEGSFLIFEWKEITDATPAEEGKEKIIPTMDEDDEVFSIVVKSASDLASSAFAIPNHDIGENNPDGKTILDCDIQIADGDLKANSLLITLVHELGHCLGLGHNHSNYGSIMGYSRRRKTSELGLDDRSGAIFIYPAEGNSADGREFIGKGCGTIKGSEKSNSNLGLGLLLLLALPLLLPRISRLLA